MKMVNFLSGRKMKTRKYFKSLLPVILFVVTLMIMPSCAPKYSFNTREGKKKLSYYNSVPYKGYPVKPSKKLNKVPK